MYGHVTTKIFQMYRLPNFLTYGARLGALGARESSAIKIYIDSCQNRATTDKYHIAISKAWLVVSKSYRSKEQPRNTRNEFPIRGDLGNSLDYEQPLFFSGRRAKRARHANDTEN